MPIHDMAQWAPKSNNVILFLEDPYRKQLVGLVCLVKKLDDALVPTSVEKGFEMKDMQDLNVVVVLEKWIELEKEDTVKDSQGGAQHTIVMVESSIAKWPRKEKIEIEKKKVSRKIVMGKEAKGFDP